jgi:hypothetical protein
MGTGWPQLECLDPLGLFEAVIVPIDFHLI